MAEPDHDQGGNKYEHTRNEIWMKVKSFGSAPKPRSNEKELEKAFIFKILSPEKFEASVLNRPSFDNFPGLRANPSRGIRARSRG